METPWIEALEAAGKRAKVVFRGWAETNCSLVGHSIVVYVTGAEFRFCHNDRPETALVLSRQDVMNPTWAFRVLDWLKSVHDYERSDALVGDMDG